MAVSLAELEVVNAVLAGRNARELEKMADEMYDDREDVSGRFCVRKISRIDPVAGRFRVSVVRRAR